MSDLDVKVANLQVDLAAARQDYRRLEAEVAERNDAMAEALEILDGYGRTNPTLPMACAELMRHHTELRIEHGKLEAKVERLREALDGTEALLRDSIERGGLMIDQAEAMDERNIALQRDLDAARNALRGWPSLECPCCGDEGAFATFFEDGADTVCGCGGTVRADGSNNAWIEVDERECPKCAALRGEEASNEA